MLLMSIAWLFTMARGMRNELRNELEGRIGENADGIEALQETLSGLAPVQQESTDFIASAGKQIRELGERVAAITAGLQAEEHARSAAQAEADQAAP